MRVVHLENICFCYQGESLLDGLCLEVETGERVAIVGRSGSGKSTLFRLLAGLEKPLEGRIDSPKLIAYMTQEPALLSWRTLEGNLQLIRDLGARVPAPTDEEIRTLIAAMGLKGFEQFFPEALSGGMRQRLALARALLLKRPLILLDEPFATLDYASRTAIYQLMGNVLNETTLLMITHDPREALLLANRVLLLKNGKLSHLLSVERDALDDLNYRQASERQIEDAILCPAPS